MRGLFSSSSLTPSLVDRCCGVAARISTPSSNRRRSASVSFLRCCSRCMAGSISDRRDKRKMTIRRRAGPAASRPVGNARPRRSRRCRHLTRLAANGIGGNRNPPRRGFVIEWSPPRHISTFVSLNTAVNRSRIFVPAPAGPRRCLGRAGLVFVSTVYRRLQLCDLDIDTRSCRSLPGRASLSTGR